MNRDVLITDFADDKKFARGFDIIVIVIVLLCVLLCIACVCVRVYRSGKWRIVEDKMEEMFHILHTYTYTKREDVVESFATRFAAARGGSGRRVCCQRCEEVFF